MNRPQRDQGLVRQAGIALSVRCLRGWWGIKRFGPIGVVELADRAGRGHTTISLQIAKFEHRGLGERKEGVQDHRLREAVVTPKGNAMTNAVDAARKRIGRTVSAHCEPQEFAELVRPMQKFAADIQQGPPAE